MTPASAGGAELRFTFEYADSDGPGDIAQAQVVINTWLDGTYGCYFIYVRDTNSVVLANENAYGTYGSVAVGSAAVLGHARCLIREPAIRTVGNSLLLDITVRFLWPFNGDRRICLLAIDTAGATGGWDHRGSWTVPAPQQPDFVLSTPQPVTIEQGSSATTVETLTAIRGFASRVNFSYSGWPTGLSASFTPAQLIPTGTAWNAIAPAPGASAGTYSLPFTATGSGIALTAALSVAVLQQTCRLIVSQPSGTPTVTRTGGNVVCGTDPCSRPSQPLVVGEWTQPFFREERR